MDQDPRSYDPYLYQITHRGNPGDRAMYLAACQGQTDVLELGCGAGRLLLPLAEAGHRVVGIDQHQGMLDSLRGHAAKDPALLDQLELHHGDITEFQLERRFDRILLPYNLLFCLLTDEAIRSCLRCVAAHLKPDGACIFDVYQVDDEILESYQQEQEEAHISIGLAGLESSGYQLVDVIDEDSDEGSIAADEDEWEQYAILHEDEIQMEIAERRIWDPATRRFDADYRYRTFAWDAADPSQFGLREEQIFTIPQTYLHHHELQALFREAGLRWTQTYGDFRGGPWDEESEHLIAWAHRIS